MKKQFVLIVLSGIFVSCTTSTPVNTSANTTSLATPAPKSTATNISVVAPKGERGTSDEARAMLEKAVEHYNSAGRQTALADFNAKKDPFGDRDLYVACIGSNDTLVANGGYPQLVGTSTDAWRDADGHPLGKAIKEALLHGENSVHYKWLNPVSGKTEPKVFFFQKVGEDVCGVGAYNPQG